MEPSLYRYILKHSRKDQIALILLSLASLPIVYITLELPKRIINMLEGKDVPESILGWEVEPVRFLMLLSFAFLAAVLINGGIKYVLNVYRGAVGERLLRRLRYNLFQQLLRFPIPHFKRVSQGELIQMITAETETLSEFFGESYALPVFQGGILFTYLFFIFQQDLYLGLAAISLYPLQLYVIPKLQKRVNQLSKERVATVRQLSGRIGETISGINEVHSNDTSYFERAHISHRLGIIFQIRYAIYRRKFFIKFLNNFIAQLTPFFFYSVGGYFVLRGDLSIGSMVAVLVAYKDLAGPWKELLTYYQRKEDIKVKYSQVIEQLSPPNLLNVNLIDKDSDNSPLTSNSILANNVSYSEDQLYFSVDGASFKLDLGQHSAVVGSSNSGKTELANLVSRLISPSGGTLALGSQNMSELPESVIGRRIGYVGQNTYLFTGSIRDNLVYPLKNRPTLAPLEGDSLERNERRQLAIAAGNTEHSIEDDWVNISAIGLTANVELDEHLYQTLKLVEFDEEVYQFGLISQLKEPYDADLSKRIMQARLLLRDQISQPDYARLVEPFDQDSYNTNIAISENLLFGTIYDDSLTAEKLADIPYIRKVLDETGLTKSLLAAGKQVAEVMLDLFSDVEPDSELFKQFSFIDAEDLPEFQQLLVRIRDQELLDISSEDQARLLSQSFQLTVARHRLGLVTDSIQQSILKARKRIRDESAEHGLGIEFFDESAYNQRISVQDNILFGKLAYGQANAQARINELIASIVKQLDLRRDIIEAGLAYDVGIGGARLSLVQRQKLGLARCLIKQPDLLIVNEATAVLDTPTERRLIKAIRERMKSKAILWVLARPQLAENFDNLMIMELGRLTDKGTFKELSESSKSLQKLLEAG